LNQRQGKYKITTTENQMAYTPARLIPNFTGLNRKMEFGSTISAVVCPVAKNTITSAICNR
jgi:hypothetical protein